MEHKIKMDKKTIFISIIVFLVIMYVMLIYNLNAGTAYKIDYNFEVGFRQETIGKFYFLTGEAKINDPHVRLEVYSTVYDEEVGEEIEVGLTVEKNILGKQKVYVALYCDATMEIRDSVYLDKSFNYYFKDPDNVDHNEKLLAICERHQGLIDELIFEADKLWDIK